MQDIFFTILESVQEWLQSSNSFDFILQGLLIYMAIFWLALVLWVIRDVINRSDNFFFQSFAIIISIIPIFGLIIYLLIRPTKTLMDSYYDEIELKTLNSWKFCNKCDTPINDDFEFCQECGIDLKKNCQYCNKRFLKTYKICPYCGNKEKKKTKKE